MLESAGNDLIKTNRRPAYKPTVKVASKSDVPCLAVADYILGVVGQYVANPKSEIVFKRFERLRDKIRLVIDADTNNRYSRKNPLNSESIVEGVSKDAREEAN